MGYWSSACSPALEKVIFQKSFDWTSDTQKSIDQHFYILHTELGKIHGFVWTFWGGKKHFFKVVSHFFSQFFKETEQLKKITHVSWNALFSTIVVKNIKGNIESSNQRILALWKINSDGKNLNVLFSKRVLKKKSFVTFLET